MCLHLLVFVSKAETKSLWILPTQTTPHTTPYSAFERLSLARLGSGMLQLKLDLGKKRRVGRSLVRVGQAKSWDLHAPAGQWLTHSLHQADTSTSRDPAAAKGCPGCTPASRSSSSTAPSPLHALLLPSQSQAAGTHYVRLLQDACPLAPALSDGCTGKCFSLPPSSGRQVLCVRLWSCAAPRLLELNIKPRRERIIQNAAT